MRWACSFFFAVAGLAYGSVMSRMPAIKARALLSDADVGVMLLWNYLITPLYMVGTTRSMVAAMLPTVFLPFNLVKGGLNMALILLIVMVPTRTFLTWAVAVTQAVVAAYFGVVSFGLLKELQEKEHDEEE